MEVDTQKSVKSYNRILHRPFGVQCSAFGVQWAQGICEISTLATLTVIRFKAKRHAAAGAGSGHR
jgi:hypothetical protein